MTILSTKILTPSQKHILNNAQVAVQDYEAIKIKFKITDIDPNFSNVIFTSQNTVKAFLKIIADQKLNSLSYSAFCVGSKTKSLLEKNGINVLEMAHYGTDLANILIKKHPNKTFLFLCGDKRRPELPSYLIKHKVTFKEQVVYQNTPNPLTFASNFDGVLFFSPSGVESYSIKNDIKNNIAFCIGTTTAAEAQKHTNNIIISNTPTVESVLEKVIEYKRTKTK